jgi:hypothetical protein
MPVELGAIASIKLEDPAFSGLLWKLSPASLAVRLSQGQFRTWNYVELLSRKLMDVAAGRCKRLVVCMPPRVGKSELISKWLLVWYLENYPGKRVILASYEADFAAKFGAKVRDIILDNQELLSIRFKVKNPAMNFLESTQGGVMMTAGAGGPITGKGANLFVIDDPIKSSEEAQSLTMREKAWDWFTSTARSRIEPGGSMVVVATRWHSDDLIGRILKKEKENIEKIAEGDRNAQIEGWEVFCFPALAEPEVERHYLDYKVPVNNLRVGAMRGTGQKESIRDIAFREADPSWHDFLGRKRGESLCPERFNENDYAKLKSINLRDWFSLYQQRPGDEADDGNVYHAFDEVVNCKPVARDEKMQLFVSMDFNVAPMSVVIGQYDRGGGIRQMERMEVLQELVLQNSNTPAMMERLLQILKQYCWGYELSVEVFGDAAGTQRSSNSSRSNWQIVAEYFALAPSLHYTFRRRKANPTISDRVSAVNSMLRSADGTSRLFVNDVYCPELVKDLKKVKWQTDPGGNSTGLLDKSDKNRTHISDALGYAVELLFSLKVRGGGKKGILQ